MSDTTEDPQELSALVTVGVVVGLVAFVVVATPFAAVVALGRWALGIAEPTPAAKLALAFALTEREAEEVLHAVDDDPIEARMLLRCAREANIGWREVLAMGFHDPAGEAREVRS